MNTLTCKRCGQQVVLLNTPKGKGIVCSLPAIRFTHKVNGKDKVISVNGETLKGTISPEGEEWGFIPHECK